MAEQRVLVVEDDSGARDALGSLLMEEGFLVRTAPNGRAALACALEFAPDVVICDFFLPDLNGLQVLRALRAMRSGTFFIMLTAGCGGVEVERALRREADLFLEKPVDLPRLRALLLHTRLDEPEPPTINALN